MLHSLQKLSVPFKVFLHQITNITQVVVATTANLIVYAIPKVPEPTSSSSPSKKRKGKQKAQSIPDLEILRTVELPASLGGVSGSTFRSARYVSIAPCRYVYSNFGYEIDTTHKMKPRYTR